VGRVLNDKLKVMNQTRIQQNSEDNNVTVFSSAKGEVKHDKHSKPTITG
jgi:hypothetical protein